MNKRHPYRDMEREYITTDISLRELSRKYGIRAHSVVVDQSQRQDWSAKREAYRAKESESFIEVHAKRMADRQAQIRDRVIDTIDLALDKFRAELKATRLVHQPDGSIIEQPAWYMTPKDLCMFIDRFEVLFGKPSVIGQHQGLTVTPELSVESLRDFIEATRGWAGPSPMEVSPLPRARGLDD